MNLEKFKKKILDKAENFGFESSEIFINESNSFDLRVFQQEVDHYSINEDKGLSFRGLYNGKLGYSYTEKIDENSIDLLLENAKQNAEIIDKEEGEIFSGSKDYKKLDLYNPDLDNINSEEKIQIVKELEKYAFDEDERIEAVNYCMYSDLEFEQGIINSKNLDLNFKNNISYLFLSVVAKENDEIRTANKFQITDDFSSFDPKKIAKEAVKEATSLFGAKTIKSGSYPVILRNDIAAKILATFSSTLSAENVQKGLSLFVDKIGEKVGSDKLNLIDDPFLEGGFNSMPFDGEGVATRKKEIIKDGELKSYLHNLKTAKKAGVDSTGNAYRSSHKSSVDIAPTNMYIEEGNRSYEELINSIDEGLIIMDVQGLHSGANSVSGDFSLGAFGYYIKNGKIDHPVEQITISGNFIEMLKNIELIANDLKLDLPGRGHFASPSLKIKTLDIAGK
ncbi:MAG: TldD/PmbA family protein [Bacillota bacterium]